VALATKVAEVFRRFLNIFEGIDHAVSPSNPAKIQAQRVLNQLCQEGETAGKGFEPERLAMLLGSLHIAARPQQYHYRAPDLLRYGPGTREKFTLNQLRSLGRYLDARIDMIRKLKRTPLVAWLQVKKQISADDVLFQPYDVPEKQEEDWLSIWFGKYRAGPPDDPFVNRLQASLETVRRLPKTARRKRAADLSIDANLTSVCEYVERTCGGPNYHLLSDLLGPLHIPHTDSQAALKVWRKRTRSSRAK
jgi:hypothetical protein